MLGELRHYLRGWIGYFGLAATKGIFASLDKWIRRRVRMCVWKQWRLPRTSIRKLKPLGVPHDLAVSRGTSRKVYWRLARTQVANEKIMRTKPAQMKEGRRLWHRYRNSAAEPCWATIYANQQSRPMIRDRPVDQGYW